MKRQTNYLTDFVAWADEQSMLLEQKRFAELDLINLIEEVQSLARRERDELENQLIGLLMHLLWQDEPTVRDIGWEVPIRDARKKIIRSIKECPVLMKHIQDENVLFQCYEYAREDAADETGLDISVFPLHCPYSIDEIMTSDRHEQQ